MVKTSHKEMLEAGVHFGHLKRKRNPNMTPYIFMERNGIHIIDLNKSLSKLEEAAAALKQVAKSGRKILFVATKKQAKDIVSKLVVEINMPFATERWPAGMLTNFHTIRKAVKKMASIDSMFADGTFDNMSKREKLTIKRQRGKLERNLGSIADLTRLPAAVFIVDINNEDIAVSEARRLKITTYAMVDTNSDPTLVDFAIPSNDDSTKSIQLIVGHITAAIAEGLAERKKDKEEDAAIAEKKKADKKEAEDAANAEAEEGAEVTADVEESAEKEETTETGTIEAKDKKPAKVAKPKAATKKIAGKGKKTTRGKRKRITAATSA